MKNLITILLLTLSISFIGCKKKSIEPAVETHVVKVEKLGANVKFYVNEKRVYVTQVTVNDGDYIKLETSTQTPFVSTTFNPGTIGQAGTSNGGASYQEPDVFSNKVTIDDKVVYTINCPCKENFNYQVN